MNKQLLLFMMGLFMMSFASAVTIGNGTLIYNSAGNNFTTFSQFNVTTLEVNAVNIELHNITGQAILYNNNATFNSTVGLYDLVDATIYTNNGTKILTGNNINGDYNISVQSGYYIYVINNFDEYMSNKVLRIHLKFDENQGTTAYDSSGNANNGTITGATWNNDGINIGLVGSQYTVTTIGGLFTLLDNSLKFSQIDYSYSYSTSTTDAQLADNASSGLGEFGNWFGIMVIIAIAGGIIYMIFLGFDRKHSNY